MKTLITIAFMTFFSITYSQKLWITGPDDTEDPPYVEVGDQVHFKAHFDPQGTGYIPVSYEWDAPFNFEHMHGVSNIDGSTDGSMGYDPITRYSSLNVNEVYIVWGDWSEATSDQISVEIDVVDGSAGHHYYTAYFDVDIYRIILASIPITGPMSIQKCCTEEVTYCEPDLVDQNAWNWTISGGGSASSSNGLHCIDVTPNNTGNITVSVTASRTENSNGYSRSASKIVTRFDPVTSPIEGFSYICKGSQLTLCVDDVCGSTGIMWIGNTDLYVNNGQGQTCATFRPNSSAANGTVVTVTAQAQFPSGCTANVSSLDVTIYDSGTPPTPSGNVTLVPALPEEYDPCSEVNITWFVIYNGTYQNGIITVNPTFVLDAPHHHHGNGPISVEVCYRNLCGSGNTCRTYTVYLPDDCVEDPIINPLPTDSLTSKAISSKTDLLQQVEARNTKLEPADALFYPNPASNSISIYTNFENGFSLELYDIDGNLVKTTMSDYNFVNLDISDISQGIFIARIFDSNNSINKKLSIVK